MHIDLLKEFITLVDCGSYTKAGELLNMDRSNLGKHIKRLEREVGVPLVRHGGIPHLTSAGRTFYAGVKPLIATYDNVLAKSREIHERHSEDMIIAEPPFLFDDAARAFYSKLEPFRTLLSDVPLRFLRYPYQAPEENVASGRVGIALMYEWGDTEEIIERYEQEGLYVEYMTEEPFVAFCPSGHRFANLKSLPIERLAEARIVASSGKYSPFKRAILSMCDHYGFEPHFLLLRKDVMLFSPVLDGIYLFPEHMNRDPRIIASPDMAFVPLEGENTVVKSFLLMNERSRELLRGMKDADLR